MEGNARGMYITVSNLENRRGRPEESHVAGMDELYSIATIVSTRCINVYRPLD